MKQFNLEEYLKNPSRKVVTRDGRKVNRFLCTDARGQYPIVALVEALDDDKESAFSYTKDGHFYPGEEHDYNLFFAPEKHEGWVNLYRDIRDITYVGGTYTSEKEAKENIYFPSRYITTIKIEWEE